MARAIENLNQLTEADIRRLLADYDSRLARSRAAVASNAGLRSHAEFLVDGAVIRRMAAHCLHALRERLEEIPELLSEAVDCYMTLFRLRNLWQEADLRAQKQAVDGSLFSAERMYAAVIDSLILGREEVLREVEAMHPAVYSNVNPPAAGSYHASIAALVAYGCGDMAAAKRRAARLLTMPGWREKPSVAVQRLRPLMEGVNALCDGDGAAVAAAMEHLLAVHGRHAREGSGARHAATLMCSEGAALAAMARRAGMPVAVASPYLPEWRGD